SCVGLTTPHQRPAAIAARMSSARPPAGPLHALDRLRMGTNHDFETDVRWSDDLAGNGSGEDSPVDAIDLVTLRGQVVFDLARKPKGLLVPHHRGDNDFLPAREEPPKLRGDIWSNSARCCPTWISPAVIP